MTREEYQYPGSWVNPNDEWQDWAEHIYQRPKSLQDLVLLLVPEERLNTHPDYLHQRPEVQRQLAQWRQEAERYDRRLRIQRQRIPHVEIFLPDTSTGRSLANTASKIGSIPIDSGVVPSGQIQCYWLRYQHYFYQAQGLFFAQSLLANDSSHIPDIEEILKEFFDEKNLQILRLIKEVDLAFFELIRMGEPEIRKQFAKHNNVHGTKYHFASTLELFLNIKQQAFIEDWQAGPASKEFEYPTLKQQKEEFRIQLALLSQEPWSAQKRQREQYETLASQYREYLSNTHWYGPTMTALLDTSWSKLDAPWQRFLTALKQAEAVYSGGTFLWIKGLPYIRGNQPHGERMRPCSSIPAADCPSCPFRHIGTDLSLSNCFKQVRKAGKTANKMPVKGSIDALGYIIWH